MMQLLRRVKKRLTRPKILSKKVVKEYQQPRRPADILQGQSRVYRIQTETNVQTAMQKLNQLFDTELKELWHPDQKILIKVNLNTSDPYPASTSCETLTALVDLLYTRGYRRIMVGDCSSLSALPTRQTAKTTGILKAVAGKAKIIYFDEGPWVAVPLPGSLLQEVTVPQAAMDADRIIFLSNMKTHQWADFSLGLKLAVGFMHPLERAALHREHLQEKAAEINLAVPADLTIIDSRTAFISGGPVQGRTAQNNMLLAGTNQLSVEVEAYRQLYALKKKHNLIEHFTEDPFGMPQLSHAKQCGLGGSTWDGYECVDL